ncbi:ECF RNA polymerase sigma factor SigW [Phycisphaerae bacterium RAS1]|nr:ECF RNA polymerase sigma factor SigW [Phycisphaerae bacterium RAS1]
MSAESNETVLLGRATAGDEQALADLLVLHHDRIVAQIAARIPQELRAALSADDVAQEAYVVVFRRIQSFQLAEHATFGAWLSGIGMNQLRDAIRNARAAKRGGGARRLDAPAGQEASVVSLLGLLATHSQTPSRSAARLDATDAVRAALAHLSDDLRRALEMRYIEGLPIAEIAARMNRTEGAVHQLCHRGLRRMAAALGESMNFFSRKE